MNGKLYKLVNSVNDKVYIGITYRSLETRFKAHLSDAIQGYDRPICKAIKELGANNFSIVLVGEYPQGELESAEIEHIALYDSFNTGYNATLGGDGSKLIPHSREKVNDLYTETKNARETARILGISKDTVLSIVKDVNPTAKVVNPLIKLVEFDNMTFNGAGECAQHLIDSGILVGTRSDIAHNINRVARGARKSYKGLKFRYSSVV